ncbi:MAG: sigma-54-dependent Fis family transcriptional regulator [Bacteroidetes bacterium]|nr:sigma-54-dependent Fis family transcriptional regulator [Bacteroidota bacterium]
MKTPLIFIVDDEAGIRRLLEHWLGTKWGYDLRLFTDAESCLAALDDAPDLIILDIMLPGMNGVDALREIKSRQPNLPVIMLSAQGQIETAVETLKLGAVDYFPKTIELPKLENAVRNALELHSLRREVTELRDAVREPAKFASIVTSDTAMDPVLRLVEKAGKSDISVLIQGESGTGKEVIARAIHESGKRSGGPFVAVNCAAIPKDLLESEMFGHEKGSFTGAMARKTGRFEQADGGTLFLDEIGEMDVLLQAKLLRAIQERKFERVGGNETLAANVRIVSATNRDLLKASHEGRFREDLYYRLATFPIQLPPLRARRSDVLLLAEHFLKMYNNREGKQIRGFERKTLKMLHDYPWPGNVRELQSAVERAVLLCDEEQITVDDLPLALQDYAAGSDAGVAVPSIFDDVSQIIPMETLKEQAVRHALKVASGNILEAAKRLDISRSTMYEMVKRYGVEA